MPQGFKNSPTLFDEALHQDLATFRIQHPTLVLLQYVDDLLLAAPTALDCDKGTGALLETLGRLGYRASAKKGPNLSDQSDLFGVPTGKWTEVANRSPKTSGIANTFPEKPPPNESVPRDRGVL